MKTLFFLTAFFNFLYANTHVLVDKVLIDKSQSKLYLQKEGKIIKSYHVVFGGNPKGHKVQEGDQRTPEGKYVLDFKKENSAYYRAIHISYPNKKDKAHAAKLGVSAGGDIMIHGQKNGTGWFKSFFSQMVNWTAGCIALKDSDMAYIYKTVPVGTPIEILP